MSPFSAPSAREVFDLYEGHRQRFLPEVLDSIITVGDKNLWLYPLQQEVQGGGESALWLKVANLFGSRGVDIRFETSNGAKRWGSSSR